MMLNLFYFFVRYTSVCQPSRPSIANLFMLAHKPHAKPFALTPSVQSVHAVLSKPTTRSSDRVVPPHCVGEK